MVDTRPVRQWSVPRKVPALKSVACVVFGLVAAMLSDSAQVIVATATALLLGASALRDVVHPVRLAADADGVNVSAGLIGYRHIPWNMIERLRLDTRKRLGIRNELLEVDTGANLYLFGSRDLGARPEDVLHELRQLAPGGEPLP